MKQTLNEKQWRQYLALEVKRKENITAVAKRARVSKNTIKRGIREVPKFPAFRHYDARAYVI